MWLVPLSSNCNYLEQGKHFLWVQYVQGVHRLLFLICCRRSLPKHSARIDQQTLILWSVKKQKSRLRGLYQLNQRADRSPSLPSGNVEELCTCKLRVSAVNPCYYHRQWFREPFIVQSSMQCLHTSVLLHSFFGGRRGQFEVLDLGPLHMLSKQSTALLDAQAGLELRNLLPQSPKCRITGMHHHDCLSVDLKPTLDYLQHQI